MNQEALPLAKHDLFESDPSFGGSETSVDDLDAFLADLKLDFPAGDVPSAGEQPAPDISDKPLPEPKRRAPEAPSRISAEPEPPEREPRAQGFGSFILRHHRIVNIMLLLICLALAAGIAAVILTQSNTDPLGGKIMENVFVAGVDVGGMSKEQALAAVNAAIGNRYAEEDMVVELGSSQLTLSSSQARPALDVQAAVNAAFSLGRTGSIAQRQQEYRKAQTTPIIISGEQYLSVDTSYIRSTLSDYLSSIAGVYSPSSFHLEGERPALDAENYDMTAPCETLVLTVGTPGSQFDLDGICSAILEGYSQNLFHVIIPKALVSQLPEKPDLDAIYQQLHVEPVEAVEDGGKLLPGSCGYTFDLEAARAQLASAGYGQVISIPMEYVLPSDLEGNGSYTETLSTYSTQVSSIEDYNQNMRLLCHQLDGLVLNPGEVFSFNAFFKDITEQNGYKKVPRHGDCCADTLLGGGMDQVASTLYVAAKTADLAVTEKHLGDHLCTYTIKGTELAVGSSWQDLKLSNPLKSSVKIRARVTDKQVIIQVLCEQAQDYYVKLETKEGYAIPHGTNFSVRSSADGYRDGQVLIEGVDGCQVILQWVKYDKATNQELSRTSETVESRAMNTVLASVSR